jgi:hypothetical protein
MAVNLPGPIASAYEALNKDQVKPAEVVEPTEGSSEAQPLPLPEPVAIEPQEPEQKVAPSEDYEKRFKGYKAHADQTIHELRTLTTTQSAELASLRYQVEQLLNQNKELKDSVPRDYIPKGVLSEEDIESLGPENAQRIAKIAEARAKEANADLRRQLEQVAHTVSARERAEAAASAKSEETSFWGRVQEIVAEAPQIDDDPRFSTFLNSVDPASGKKWRKLGEDAKATGNVRAMAQIFQEFQKAHAPPSRKAEVTPRGAQAGAQSPNAGSKKIWTQKEFQDTIYGVMKGGRMTPEKTQQIEKLQAEFQAALRENRVRG